MITIPVQTSSSSYVVVCGRGALAQAGALVGSLESASGVYFLSSPVVWKHLHHGVSRGFGRSASARPILFADAERAKTLRTFEALCRALVRAGADRRAVIVAIGGGVVGDVAGYVAASYLRGVRLVHIPTTLVAQVDSSIGGKTGVNLPEAKNLVGAFHPPSLVICDPDVLSTLSPRQFRSGLHEVIKYGVIGDRRLFEFLENRMARILARDRASLDWILPRCIGAKVAIVERDERESGLREILNFGHTIGHALEAITQYQRFLHGEAVGWGMIAAARLAVANGQFARAEAERIERLVFAAGPLPSIPRIAETRWLAAMRSDKKARRGRLRFILPRAIGEVTAVDEIPETMVRRVVSQLAKAGR